MDKPISVGDLVMVVRWPCCGAGLGNTATVAGLHRWPDNWKSKTGSVCCGYHHNQVAGTPFVIAEKPNGARRNWPLAWLKRIPPLDELEGASEDVRRKTPQEFQKQLDKAIEWLKS